MNKKNERPRLGTGAAVTEVGQRKPDLTTAATHAGTPSIEPLLSMDDLRRILRISRSKLERLRAAGRIPHPDVDLRTVSKPIPRWRPETIRRWIEGGGTP